MRSTVLFVLLSFFLANTSFAELKTSSQYEKLIVRYNKLMAETTSLRVEGERLYKYIKPRLKSMELLKVLTGEDIGFVHDYFQNAYKHSQDLKKFASELPVSNFDEVTIEYTNGATKVEIETSLLNIFLGRSPYEYTYKINPKDRLGMYYLTVIKMSYGIYLGMYDNFIISLSPFYKKGSLRRLINNDNVEMTGILDNLVENFLDQRKKEHVGLLYNFYLKFRGVAVLSAYHDDHQVIDNFIQTSYTHKNFFTVRNIQDSMRVDRFFTMITDFLVGVTQSGLNELSRVFGAIVGNVRIPNSGRMLKLTSEQRQDLAHAMKPLDVIVERSAFHLTNSFIPGHFGHVAIWAGTENELKELGVWEELPEIEARARRYFGYQGPSFQNNIRQGRYIIEALRPGVQMNTLDHFLDINDMAVFSPVHLTKTDKKAALIRAFEQVGKDYDFQFNVETDRTIVCSELAYITFDTFPWPTESSFGRYTIEPDHVARLGLDENYFEISMLYMKGEKDFSPRRQLERLLNRSNKKSPYKL